MQPSFKSILPFGPIRVTPSLPIISHDSLTGGFIPNLKASVFETST